jgi:hypothetical protein
MERKRSNRDRKKNFAVIGALLGVMSVIIMAHSLRSTITLFSLSSNGLLGSAIMAESGTNAAAPATDEIPFIDLESFQADGFLPYSSIVITYTTRNVVSCTTSTDKPDVRNWLDLPVLLNEPSIKTPSTSSMEAVKMGKGDSVFTMICQGKNGETVADSLLVDLEKQLAKPVLNLSSEECGKTPMVVTTILANSEAIIPTSCVNIGTHASPWDIFIKEVVAMDPGEGEEMVQVRCDTYPSSDFGYVFSNKLVRHYEGSSFCQAQNQKQ